MEYTPIEEILHPKQNYVREIADKLGLKVKAVKHEIATNTCFEKSELLGWPAERIVKAVFFNKDKEVYGFVFPELGKEESPKYIDKIVLSYIFGITSSQAKKFRNSYCPEGMEYGTCTPFVLEDAFEIQEKKLRKIFIHKNSTLEESIVDISMGGFGEKAHKTSLHLLYDAIYKILNYRFGDKIEKTNLFKNI